MTENIDFKRASVALVDFAADDHIPELLREYTTVNHNKSFNNSRLVLNSDDEINMQNRDPNDDETSKMKGVSRLTAGNINSHYQYDSLDVAPPKLDQMPSSGGIDDVEVLMENGKRITPEGISEDDMPLDISTGAHHAGAAGASAEGSDDDSYDHCHAPLPMNSTLRAQKQLIAACCVTIIFMIGEVVGGYLSGSLAIMTDASHLLSDVASFAISIFALWIARRPATTRMSFGYYRAEVLGAVISVLIIWVLTGVLCYLAVERIIHQEYTIDANIMLITAGVGVGINITLIVILQAGGTHLHSHGGGGGHQHLQEDVERGGETEGRAGHKKHNQKKNINVRAAFIHVLGDLIQSIGVLIAAGIIKAKPEWRIADPICTFMFSALVLITTFTILRDAINVLMEAVPKSINYPSFKEDLTTLPGVKMAHSLHVWSLTTSRVAMAVHLAIDEQIDNDAVLQQASNMVRTKYGIHFSTIQVEKYQPIAMENCVRCSQPC